MVAPLRALSAFALLAGAAAQLCNPVKDPFCCRDKKTRCAQLWLLKTVRSSSTT